MERDELKRKFSQQLDLFTFFHLGSDADIVVAQTDKGLQVSIRHHRVEPLRFAVSWERLEAVLRDEKSLEQLLLQEILPHRR